VISATQQLLLRVRRLPLIELRKLSTLSHRTSFALLVNPTHPALAEPVVRGVQAEARTLGIELHLLHASSDSDLDAAFATAARLQAAGLVVGPDVLFNSRIEQLASLSIRHGLPTVYQWREFVAAGGLLSFSRGRL
jgi:putative tryptophan/tyrosine transport system substrate-binding protein